MSSSEGITFTKSTPRIVMAETGEVTLRIFETGFSYKPLRVYILPNMEPVDAKYQVKNDGLAVHGHAMDPPSGGVVKRRKLNFGYKL